MGWLALDDQVRDTEALNPPAEESNGLQRGAAPQKGAPLMIVGPEPWMGPLIKTQEIKFRFMQTKKCFS